MAKEILITGSGGFIGSYLAENLDNVTSLRHQDCDLTDWRSVKDFPWEGGVVVNCAHVGVYGRSSYADIPLNIRIFENIRARWPKAKLISFGSGAMYDRRNNLLGIGEYDETTIPAEPYSLSKRLTVDMADVTLIPFGVFGNTRFVKMVRENTDDVVIFQDIKFSWVNLSDLPLAVSWAIRNGSGRYNLCGYDMTLTEMALYLGAQKIRYLKEGMGKEYTGRRSIIPLACHPRD